MEAKRIEDDTKGSFIIENEEGSKSAELAYTKAGPDRIIINHTEVNGELKGKGAGKLLVKTMVDYARANQISVIPLCSFTRKEFMEHPEYNDVL